jgi:hypothetical protein
MSTTTATSHNALTTIPIGPQIAWPYISSSVLFVDESATNPAVDIE